MSEIVPKIDESSRDEVEQIDFKLLTLLKGAWLIYKEF